MQLMIVGSIYFDISIVLQIDPWQDLKDDYGKGGYERITNLRQQFPHLKVNNGIVDISHFEMIRKT